MLPPDANVPGLHGVSTVLPVGAKWPTVVSVHPLRLRSARPLWAVRARLAGDAPFLALAGLVRACRALVTGALFRDGLDGARAALGLLSAARRRGVARGGLRAPTAAGEVGGAGVRAFSARQRRAGTRWTVRAGHASSTLLFALVGLVRTGCASVARTLACDGLDGAGAAGRLLRAARRRKASLVRWRALTGDRQVGGDRVRALRARQRRAGARWAERAGLAGDARLFALAGLVRACLALVAGALLREGLDVAGAALGLLGAARRRGVARGGLVALVLAA
eukprot:scaffold2722_cov64-Phaeocystis_antarctica.AAC.1